MPSFSCQACGAAFEVPQGALDRFPGWTPGFCKAHSPRKGGAGGARRKGTVPRAAFAREENLTLAQVLERYPDGPADGVFTDEEREQGQGVAHASRSSPGRRAYLLSPRSGGALSRGSSRTQADPSALEER